MIIQKFNDEQEWLDGRMGKVTGTRLKDLVMKRATKPKKGFWEVIAERVALPPSDENVMDRGHRLESLAIEAFSKKTGKKVNTDLVMWIRSDNPDMAISPDGYMDEKKITEAVEVKCLNSASHIEAYINKEIPSDYEYQVRQYFIVNDDLETLYFVFYDPRMPIDMFYLEVHRKDIQAEIDELMQVERESLIKMAEIEKLLTF